MLDFNLFFQCSLAEVRHVHVLLACFRPCKCFVQTNIVDNS